MTDPTLDVASDLRAIRDLARDLPAQAAAKANSTEGPGGLAMVALAPVASPEAALNVVDSIESGRLPFADELADNDDDWEPPLWVLVFWSEDLRPEPIARPTIETEATFLLENLAAIYAEEPHFDDFAKDIRQARRRLEDVLYDGEREERSWVPCLDCDTGRDGQPIAIRLVKAYGSAVAEDRWKCPRCRRRYVEAEFNQAQAAALQRDQEARSA